MKCIYAICNLMPIYKSWDYFFFFFFLSIWSTRPEWPASTALGGDLEGKQKDILRRGFFRATGIRGNSWLARTQTQAQISAATSREAAELRKEQQHQ